MTLLSKTRYMLTPIGMLPYADQLRAHALRGDSKRINALLASGHIGQDDLISTGRQGKTALQLATGAGRSVVALLLRTHITNVVRVLELEEELHDAAIKGDHASVDRILSSNLVDVDNKNYSGCTALYLASGLGHEKTIEVLIKHGADVCLTSTILDKQETPMFRAVKNGFVDCAMLLLAATNGTQNPFPEFNAMMAAISFD